MSEAHLVLWESSQLPASLWTLLPLKERCRRRACPRASCTFSIRVLHAPEEGEGQSSQDGALPDTFPPPSPLLPTHPPSSLPPR